MERAVVRKTALARRHRNNATIAERQLWALLRRRQLDGLRFRRQFPVGRYFADLFCPKARLAIEVDGDSHLGRDHLDRVRDAFFRRRGITVLRVSNQLVLEQPDVVVQLIKSMIRSVSPLTQRSAVRGARGEKARGEK